MEGFWTVQFTGVQGFSAGVLTLMKGQVFGGDSNFLYRGTYSEIGDMMTARVHVRRFAGIAGVTGVMARDEFDLQITGAPDGDTITVDGVIPGTALRLAGTLTKQQDLPS